MPNEYREVAVNLIMASVPPSGFWPCIIPFSTILKNKTSSSKQNVPVKKLKI
jgi:hypothetical protein